MHPYARGGFAAPNKLIGCRAPKRGQGREELEALHHVGLAHGIRADEHGQGAYAVQIEGFVASEVEKRYVLNSQGHSCEANYPEMRTGMTRYR